MTHNRTAVIAGTFTRWLERYSPPTQMRANERAQQDEVRALLGVLLRYAPETDYSAFLARVLDQLEYQMKTRAWPTKAEVGAACVNTRKEFAQSSHSISHKDMSPAAINARRMLRGEAVGEHWLYGENLRELMATGLIDRATLIRYQRSAPRNFGRDANAEGVANEWAHASFYLAHVAE